MKINLKIAFLIIYSVLISFSYSENKPLLSQSTTNENQILNNPTWGAKSTIEIGSPITALVYSPNENQIVAGSQNTIHIYSVSGNLIKTIENAHEGNILDLKFSSTGHYLASSGSDKKIKIWDAYQNFDYKKTIQVHPKPCPTIAFLPGSNILATGCTNGDIKICNILKAEILFRIPTNRPINSMAFSYDKKNFTCGMNISHENTEKLNIWNLINNDDPTKFMYGLENYFINSVTYSQFEDYMGCICSISNEILPTTSPDNSEIIVISIDFQNNPGIQIIKKINDPELCNSIDFLDNNNIVAGYKNGKIKIWNFSNSQLEQYWQAHNQGINKLLLMPQNRLIISAGNDGYIKIWERII